MQVATHLTLATSDATTPEAPKGWKCSATQAQTFLTSISPSGALAGPAARFPRQTALEALLAVVEAATQRALEAPHALALVEAGESTEAFSFLKDAVTGPAIVLDA